MHLRLLAAGLLALIAATSALAGTIYEVTATDGKEKVTYRVKFGGGKAVGQWTAFDPKSKKFVYLQWKSGETPPEPVATIWDHRTGETVKLYKFPDAEHPLPVIPSIKDMKVCPLTGDKEYTSKRVGNYD
jgi:hypothetical protein